MIRRLMWFFVGVVLVTVPMLASAAYQWRVYVAGIYGPVSSSSDAALAGFLSVNTGCGRELWSGYAVVPPAAPTGTSTAWTSASPGSFKVYFKSPCGYIESGSWQYRYFACTPAGEGQAVGSCGCAANLIEQGGICIKPCTAGDAKTTRAWVGYAATRDNVYDWINPTWPTTTCDGQCAVGGLDITVGSCSVASELGGPPYRGSCEFSGIATGATCTTASGTASDAPPPIPCPAGTYEGSVNGVPGCYGGYQGSEVTQTTNNPDGSVTKTTTKVSPDGASVKETETVAPDGTVTKTREIITSTPAPGSGPLPGQGTGTGGETGGGSSGGAASGTGEKGDTEQADFCRDNPKSLMCQDKLKIDETGTPEGGDPLKGERDGIGAAWDSAKSTLEGDTWRKSALPFVWAPSIPSGSCSGWEIYGRTIDLCDEMAKVRELWAWVIYMVGAASLWALGVRAMSGGK